MCVIYLATKNMHWLEGWHGIDSNYKLIAHDVNCGDIEYFSSVNIYIAYLYSINYHQNNITLQDNMTHFK